MTAGDPHRLTLTETRAALDRGAFSAVELVADKATKRAFDPKKLVGGQCVKYAQNEGLILRNLGDAVAVCPPLIITEDEIGLLFDRLERALDRTEAWVAEGQLRAA